MIIVRKKVCIILIVILFSTSVISNGVADSNTSRFYEDYDIDIAYVYNFTTALSSIIYTEYDENQGEIAKSRAFGTKGEHRAADILRENMSDLGLYVTVEQIRNTDHLPTVASKIEVLDYQIAITHLDDPRTIIEGYISPASKGPRDSPHQISYNFSCENVSIFEKPTVGHPLEYLRYVGNYNQDFVFITEDTSYNPDIPDPLMKQLLSRFFSPYSDPVLFWTWVRYQLELRLWYIFFPHCQGLIRYDFHNTTHNMDYATNWDLPVIFINGTDGNTIMNHIETSSIDFYINQRFNTSVISYNIIGQLNGTDPSQIIIVDSLYDSVWTQGTADSAIGMSIVMGIAKYFTDHNLIPKYTLQFIGFGGEEYGFRGALYHEASHKDDQIRYVIDLNQLGFTQSDPPLYLELLSNNRQLLDETSAIAQDYDYANQTGSAGVRTFLMPLGAPSNDQPFARNRFNCQTLCLLKGLNWVYHHRDGLNHTEGDSLKYFNETDVALTSQIVLDLVKRIALET